MEIELLFNFTKSRVFTVLPTVNQMKWSQMELNSSSPQPQASGANLRRQWAFVRLDLSELSRVWSDDNFGFADKPPRMRRRQRQHSSYYYWEPGPPQFQQIAANSWRPIEDDSS